MPEQNLDFDKRTERRNTDSLKFDFALWRGRPENVLPFWVADMDFKTSGFILDELKKRVEHGIFGYTETSDRYFKAVAGWMKERHGLIIPDERWILKTPGVVFALAMAVKAYSEKGDAVLIQQPVYYPFKEVIEDNDRVAVSNDLILGDDGKYHIDFVDFEKKIEENNIRLFLFCSPHNPVGRVWKREELERLAEICIKYNVTIVSDEIHEDFVFEGHCHISFLNVRPELKNRLITCTSPAKSFNLAGLQISNIIIPDPVLRRKLKKQIDAAGYSQANALGIAACEAAYTKGGEWFDALKKYLQENLVFLRTYLAENLPQVKLIEPEGTYLVWLDFRSLGLNTEGLNDLIVNKAGLWLDDGAVFGKTGEGFERINIATDRAMLKEGLERLKRAIKAA